MRPDPTLIAILTVSDRAAQGVYEDQSGPAAEDWIRKMVISPIRVLRQILPDERERVAEALRGFAGQAHGNRNLP